MEEVMRLCNFFFFNDTATTEIYTLSLHDALPISLRRAHALARGVRAGGAAAGEPGAGGQRRTAARAAPLVRPQRPDQGRADRKSTRLNSSHANISYAVFCLKKKKLHSSPFSVYKL